MNTEREIDEYVLGFGDNAPYDDSPADEPVFPRPGADSLDDVDARKTPQRHHGQWSRYNAITDSWDAVASTEVIALDQFEEWLNKTLAIAAAAHRDGAPPPRRGVSWENIMHDKQHARAQLRKYRQEIGR